MSERKTCFRLKRCSGVKSLVSMAHHAPPPHRAAASLHSACRQCAWPDQPLARPTQSLQHRKATPLCSASHATTLRECRNTLARQWRTRRHSKMARSPAENQAAAAKPCQTLPKIICHTADIARYCHRAGMSCHQTLTRGQHADAMAAKSVKCAISSKHSSKSRVRGLATSTCPRVVRGLFVSW